MEALEILESLRKSQYKYTQANTIRDILKTMHADDRKEIIVELMIMRDNTENSDIKGPIDEVLFNLWK